MTQMTRLLFYSLLSLIQISNGCKKSTVVSNSSNNGNNGSGNNGGGNVTPVDPSVANTIGFFLNDWEPKNFSINSYDSVAQPTGTATSYVSIDASSVITKIPKSIYGQNSNSWMTQIVTDAGLLNNINNLHSGVIPFPGGSISDMYFWNQTSSPPS